MSKSAVESLHKHYVLGLLSGCKSMTDMKERGLLPFGKQYGCKLLAQDPQPQRHALTRRLPEAPEDAYLAVDLLTVKHEGQRIEGIGRHYSSSHRGVFWGHTLVSSALVRRGEDPYLLRCDPFLDERLRAEREPTLSTPRYPQLTATEAMLNVAGDVVAAGYKPRGVLMDAQFTTRLGLRSLKHLPLPFVGRFRTDAKVIHETQAVNVRDLADRYPPGKARWYPQLRRYVKRLKVVLPEVGEVDLLIVWKAQGTGWHLTALISTLDAGVQELVRAWNARWSLEVGHRLEKQNLALEACQCLAFAAHLQHADLVQGAFNLIQRERGPCPGLTWKEAQRQAAARLRKSLLTEQVLKAA